MTTSSPARTDQSEDRQPVEDMLCLSLYAAGRAMTAAYRRLLDGHDLTYPQYLVLLVLQERGGVTIGELGEELRLESSTLSPLAKRLQTQGLLDRRRSPSDERTVLVSLTELGRAKCAEIAAVPGRISAATGLDDAAQADLVTRLRELERQLDQHA